MANPNVVTKDRSFATVHPNFGFDTHPQRGCPPFRCHAFGGLRGGLSPRTLGSDSSPQTAVEFAASASQSHLKVRPFTTQGTG
jgi:hypothetical protein